DKDLVAGWGHRPANWEFSAMVQHELTRGIGVDVGYFRRIWKNFRVTDNLLVGPEDYTKFSMVVPTDGNLESTSGTTVTGLYDVNPLKFGLERNLNTLDSKYGKQQDHWNGIDVNFNARLQNGLMMQAGLSTGGQMEDNCEIVAKLPEMLRLTGANSSNTPG